jgi:hypothetical protein
MMFAARFRGEAPVSDASNGESYSRADSKGCTKSAASASAVLNRAVNARAAWSGALNVG